MKSWFNHIYLTNLYEALKPSQYHAHHYKQPLSEVRIGSSPIDLLDPGVQRFFAVVGFSADEEGASLRAIKSAFFKWALGHSWGPGSYDSSKVDELFDVGSAEGGFRELDRLFSHMSQVTLTEVIERTEILYDPLDPGLHGDACYRSHLDVVGLDLPNMCGRRASIAMGSDLKHLIPLVVAEVAAQSERYNQLQILGAKSPEFQAESAIRRAKPTDIYVELNGVEVLHAKIPNMNVGETFEIDWSTLNIEDAEQMKRVSAAMPKAVGRKIKTLFLENDLGM
jgi:hypothetical protein